MDLANIAAPVAPCLGAGGGETGVSGARIVWSARGGRTQCGGVTAEGVSFEGGVG